MQAAFAEQQSHLPAKLQHLRAFGLGRFLGRAVFHQFDAQHQPLAPHIADERMFSFELFQARQEVAAELMAICLQLLLLDDFQDGLADRANNRIASERVEVDPFRQHAGNLRRRHHRRQWAAIADAFGHRHDIGNCTLRFKAPEMRAGAPKPGLHFVGDADAARRPHVLIDVLEIAVRENYHAAYALNGLSNKAGHLPGRREVDELLDVRGVLSAGLGIIVAVRPAVRVGHRGVMHAETVGHIELPRAMGRQAHAGGVAAVIGVAQRDDIVIAGVGAGHQQRQIVGLGTRIDEIADLELARHLRGQLLRILGDVGVQVDRGRVLEGFILAARGFDDVRVAMPDADRHDAAQAIQVAPAGFVPHILHGAFDQHDRLFVIQKNAGVEELFAQGQHLLGRGAGVAFWLVIG